MPNGTWYVQTLLIVGRWFYEKIRSDCFNGNPMLRMLHHHGNFPVSCALVWRFKSGNGRNHFGLGHFGFRRKFVPKRSIVWWINLERYGWNVLVNNSIQWVEFGSVPSSLALFISDVDDLEGIYLNLPKIICSNSGLCNFNVLRIFRRDVPASLFVSSTLNHW